MTKLVLMTRPQHDRPTQYLHFLSGKLKKEIKAIGEYNIIDLEGRKATRKELEKVLDKFKPRLIIFNGHGSYNSVSGHNNEIILDINNVRKLESKIVYAVVCDSSLELGEFSIQEGGAEAYIGYESNFMVIIEPARSSTPNKDKNFKPFVEVYVTLVIALLSGFTIRESIEKTKRCIRSLIRDYGILGIRDKYGNAPLIRFALYWNLFFLKVHGNSDAVF